MDIAGIALVCFSPTGTTRRVLDGIAAGVGLPVTGRFDVTRPGQPLPALVTPQTLLLLGAPVYGGRGAAEAMRRFAGLRGAGGPAIPVVVYGNRHYDDALLELADLVSSRNFVPVAGAAFVGEHSFSSSEVPIAHGRPDRRDLDLADRFGQRVARKLASSEAQAAGTWSAPLPELPGTRPLKEIRPRSTHLPLVVDLELCRGCGKCVDACPVGAISEGGRVSNRETCLHCFACVKSCPAGARSIPAMATWAARLAEHCRARREPEIFI